MWLVILKVARDLILHSPPDSGARFTADYNAQVELARPLQWSRE